MLRMFIEELVALAAVSLFALAVAVWAVGLGVT